MSEFSGLLKEANLIGGSWSSADSGTRIDVTNPATGEVLDLGRAFRLNQALNYGLIGINSGLITTVEAPFGGLGESGLGSGGGSQGLDDYLDTKYTCVAGPDG